MSDKPKHADDRSHLVRDLFIWIAGVAFFAALTFGLLAFFADPTTPGAEGTTTSTTSTSLPGSTTSTPPDGSSTTSVPPDGTSTTVPVRPPSEVTVQVLNYGEGIPGAAGRLTQQLAQEGYQILPATDFSPTQDPSRIWYRDGFAAEANELLEFVPGARVEPLPQPDLSPAANIIIVLGIGYEE